jgi:hypothetical protein
MRNTASNQEDVDSDYLFDNFLQFPAYRSNHPKNVKSLCFQNSNTGSRRTSLWPHGLLPAGNFAGSVVSTGTRTESAFSFGHIGRHPNA